MVSIGLSSRHARSQWVRLRTLIMLRWMAITGQLAAITISTRYFNAEFDLGLAYLVVTAAVIANLIAVLYSARNRRLSDTETMLVLLFDLAQLSLLLYLTGGITNPFALLILAPVTISATALELRSTVVLGAAAVASVSLLALYHVPLRFADGSVLTVPPLFEFGFWLAIVIGILFIGLYSRRVAGEIHQMSDALLATQSTLAREQTLSDLGGMVAAAAHELGTPLATIKLASAELVEELSDRPDLREDAELIRRQADRCRDILRSMGRSGIDDVMLQQAPLGAVLREAAEPHAARGKNLLFDISRGPRGEERQPQIQRRPEIIHGLRNLIQNAVDFATSTVWVDATWTNEVITIRIIDDGPGFPPPLLGRIGDPFVRYRLGNEESRQRPGYEGMGLGLFISKTLLERTGAEISFANAADPQDRLSAARTRQAERDDHPHGTGAIVEIVWPRERIVAPPPLSPA